MTQAGAMVPGQQDARRPIEEWERPYLLAFAAEFRELRRLSGLSQERLARTVAISDRQIRHLEAGTRRPRLLTLKPMVDSMVISARGQHPKISGSEWLGRLVRAVGPAMAADSRAAARARRRYDKRKRMDALVEERAMKLMAERDQRAAEYRRQRKYGW